MATAGVDVSASATETAATNVAAASPAIETKAGDDSLPPQEVEKSLYHSILDGCAHAVMLGAGEAYLSPFAIFLGATSFELALLTTLPMLVGAAAQLPAVRFLDSLPRRRLLVMVPALLQALTWVPIFLLPALYPDAGLGPTILLLTTVPYFALGSFGNPPWNSWMGDLVHPARRGDYFGRRDRLRTGCQVSALLCAGVSLDLFQRREAAWIGFACIFTVAALARLVSTLHLARMSEPAYTAPAAKDTVSFPSFLRHVHESNFGRFTIYVAAMQLATNIAGPFFSMYMLRHLGWSYLEFTLASGVCILAQSLTFHAWGKVGDQLGNFKILQCTGIFLPVLPWLWLISSSFAFVLVIQLVSGLLWAGFNLSAANFIFDSVAPSRRARYVAYYNLLTNAAIFIGAAAGGLMARRLPAEWVLGGVHLHFASNLQWLFLFSGIARLGVYLCFLPLVREVREVPQGPVWKVFVRVVGIQPIRGLRFSVMSGYHPSERPEEPEPPLPVETTEAPPPPPPRPS